MRNCPENIIFGYNPDGFGISEINVTLKRVYLLISKLHSISAVTNLLVHYTGKSNCITEPTFRSNIYFAGDGM